MAYDYSKRSTKWLELRRAQIERGIIRRTSKYNWYLGSQEFRGDIRKLKPIDVELRSRKEQLPLNLGEK